MVRVRKNITLEDKDGVLPYIKRWKKMDMGHWHKSEDGKRWRWGTGINQKMEKDGDGVLTIFGR